MLFVGERSLFLQVHLLACFSIALIISSCGRSAHRDEAAFEKTQDFRREHHLYQDLAEPLFAGQALLTATLPEAQTETRVFQLSAGSARMSNSSLDMQSLWAADKAIFMRVAVASPSQSPEYRWYYFDPHSIDLIDVDEFLEETSAEKRTRSSQKHFRLFRAMPINRKPATGIAQHDIIRFDFTIDTEQGLQVHNAQRITSLHGDNIQPLYFPQHQEIVFLNLSGTERTQRHGKLYRCDPHGDNLQPLIDKQKFEAGALNWFDQNSFLFSANPNHDEFQLYRYDFSQNDWTVHDSKNTRPQRNLRHILAGQIGLNGAMPVTLQLPERYDLATLLALCNARNTSINKRRALLAAALIEAQRIKLQQLPTLSFGLAFTPASGLLTPGNVATGDFLAAGLARGLIGLVEELFDDAEEEAEIAIGDIRARIARDAVKHEINIRQAELAEFYFQGRYYGDVSKLYSYLIELLDAQIERNRERVARGLDLRNDLLSLEATRASVVSDYKTYLERYNYAIKHLHQLCNLPQDLPMQLDETDYLFTKHRRLDFGELQQLALLNHPRLQTSRKLLTEAFFTKQIRSPLAPTGSVGVTYGNTRDNLDTAVDDYITMSLSGRLPVGHFKDKKYAAQHWQDRLNALQLEDEELLLQVNDNIHTAINAFHESQRSFDAHRQRITEALDDLRLARLYEKFPLVDIGAEQRLQNKYGEERQYLETVAQQLRFQADLGSRYSGIWREVGMMQRLNRELSTLAYDQHQIERSSLWLWKSKDVLASTSEMDKFLSLARRFKVKRVYCYMYAPDELLGHRYFSEALTLFIQRCARYDIDVWALIGEPEWLHQEEPRYLDKLLKQITQYNQQFNNYEPSLAGIKVDIEPHTQTGWFDDAVQRGILNERFIELLKRIRRQKPQHMDMWADCPVAFFRDPYKTILDDLARHVDGVTVMAYNKRPDWIKTVASETLQEWNLPLEIGLEFSSHAPAQETLAQIDLNGAQRLFHELINGNRNQKHFSGLALHDYRALQSFAAGDPTAP